MKKTLSFLTGILLWTILAQAQQTHCGLSINKSGTGLNRTYTLTVPGPVPSYYFDIFPNAGVTTTGTGNVKTSSFTYGGYYSISLNAYSYCSDSVYQVDTIYGPINCAGITAYLSISGTATNKSFFSYYGGNTDVPGYTATITYNYGDGTSGTSTSHTYTSSGTYTVTATTVFTHPSYGSCTKTASGTVTVSIPASFSCANANAAFTYSGSGSTYTFVNTSSNTNTAPATVSYQWRMNGSTFASGTGNKTFYFNSNGTYNVQLIATWMANGAVLCRDTASQTINITTVPPPPNVIAVVTYWDSTLNLAYTPLVKTWLIKYDSATQMLSAVDSMLVTGNHYNAYTSFSNKPAGSYRVKSHIINQPAIATTGLLPTYGLNAAYWQNATVYNHTGTTTTPTVLLQQGTPLSGPGFVGGSVVQGANRNTSAGDPIVNATVLLRNGSGTVITSTLTDAQGEYRFQNVPAGTYTVYPEEINFITYPSTTITIAPSGGNTGYLYNFRRNETDRVFLPFTTALSVDNTVAQSFQVYPNPAQRKLTIVTPAAVGTVELRLVNLLGATVFRTQLAAGTQTLELPSLASGPYQLLLESAREKTYQLLLIQQ